MNKLTFYQHQHQLCSLSGLTCTIDVKQLEQTSWSRFARGKEQRREGRGSPMLSFSVSPQGPCFLLEVRS